MSQDRRAGILSQPRESCSPWNGTLGLKCHTFLGAEISSSEQKSHPRPWGLHLLNVSKPLPLMSGLKVPSLPPRSRQFQLTPLKAGSCRQNCEGINIKMTFEYKTWNSLKNGTNWKAIEKETCHRAAPSSKGVSREALIAIANYSSPVSSSTRWIGEYSRALLKQNSLLWVQAPQKRQDNRSQSISVSLEGMLRFLRRKEYPFSFIRHKHPRYWHMLNVGVASTISSTNSVCSLSVTQD